MILAMWTVSAVLLLFSLYMTLMNWAVFINNHILRKEWASAVPLVGGMAGVLGMLLLPVSNAWRFAWIPLLADWGSLPVIVVSLISARRRMDGDDEKVPK